MVDIRWVLLPPRLLYQRLPSSQAVFDDRSCLHVDTNMPVPYGAGQLGGKQLYLSSEHPDVGPGFASPFVDGFVR